MGSATLATHGHAPLEQSALEVPPLPHPSGALDVGTSAARCPSARGNWAMEPMLQTTTLPGGIMQPNPCHTLRQCAGAVGSGDSAVHYQTSQDRGHSNSCHTPPHHLGNGQRNSYHTLPHHGGAVGLGTRYAHYHAVWRQRATRFLMQIAWGHCAVELLPHTTSLTGCSGELNPVGREISW